MRHAPLVALGAAGGALARHGLALWSVDAPAFPWATLVANLVGCAAIGWCSARLDRESATWALIVSGGLGGLTTASAFAIETRALVVDHPLVAVGYVAASVGGGFAIAAIARRLGSSDRPVTAR